ncbi:bifunctional DNA primase/polymerase, partial [PVC group bacterium]|nr:bifunctional DNA primase/polymerase [PVC group bacterium]
MGLVETALEYAGRGWATIPFRRDKKPLYDDWPNKATTEPGQVTQYFTKYPNAIIAIVTGEKSGIWVLDIDVYAGKPGMESLLELERKYGELPETVRALSWSKGSHYYFKYTKPVRNRTGKGETAGIDVRGDGGCIFAPGSHYKGEK